MAGGIVLTTRGWTGAEVAFAHTTGTATYAVSGDKLNAYDVATALAAWLDDAARPWAAALTGVTWTVEDDTDGRLAFVFAFTGTTFTSITGNAAWLDRIAISDQSILFGLTGVTRGSCSAVPATYGWEPWDRAAGGRSRAASWRTGHPVAAHRRPAVEVGCDLTQTFTLSEAFRLASEPRTAYVYDELADTWRWVTVGSHEFRPHQVGDVTHYLCSLSVLGGP